MEKRELKKGYTTGTCAAVAAACATRLLLSQGDYIGDRMNIKTPKGVILNIPVEESEYSAGEAVCGVRKYSGDDPDVTNGAMVYAKVRLEPGHDGRIILDGGLGIGRVTKPGLACEVGEAAINPIPREMILKEVENASREYGYTGDLFVEISIPDGVELSKKTFNPMLGIEGGISVLGTSGIVEPMSEQALIDTIKVEINVKLAEGYKSIILTPGNYGEKFLSETLGLGEGPYIKCSNFIGDTIAYACDKGIEEILIIGHIGKLIKVAGGMMNTHSKYGDTRMDTLRDICSSIGGDSKLSGAIKECVTTEEAVKLIKEVSEEFENSVWEQVTQKIKKQIYDTFNKDVEVIIYSNKYGTLGDVSRAVKTAESIVSSEGGK